MYVYKYIYKIIYPHFTEILFLKFYTTNVIRSLNSYAFTFLIQNSTPPSPRLKDDNVVLTFKFA